MTKVVDPSRIIGQSAIVISMVGRGIRNLWRSITALIIIIVAALVGLCVGFLVGLPLAAMFPDAWGRTVPNACTIVGMLGGGWIAAYRLMPRRFGLSDSHGSAAFASIGAVECDMANPNLTANPSALLVGRGDGKAKPLLRYAGPAHLLTIMPTRAGKGVGSILPNLLTAKRSIICIDPKGENARIAARARRAMGPVWVLDPFAVSGQVSAHYDPMASLKPDSLDLADDAATLAGAIVTDPPGSSDPFWNEEAVGLISGLLLHIASRKPGNEPSGLPELRRLLTLPLGQWFYLLEAMQANTDAADGLVSRAAARQLGKPEREAGSVLSSAQRHTHFLDSRRIAKVSARSDFRFSDLRAGIVTVFLVLPPDRFSSYSRWLRLLVSQAIQELARSPQMAGQPPVLMLLDEFASLGRLEPALQAYGLMAGLGVQLWGSLQDLTQLKAIYGTNSGTFLANSGLVQASAPADLETTQWLSRSLGNATISFETTSTNVSSSSSGLLGSSSRSSGSSRSINVTGRPLLSPDETMRMHESRQILLRLGQLPALVGKLRHYQDAEFAGLFD